MAKPNPARMIQNLGKWLAKEMEKQVRARMKDWRNVWTGATQLANSAVGDIQKDADKLYKKGPAAVQDAINDAKDSVNDAGKKASNAVKKATKKLGF